MAYAKGLACGSQETKLYGRIPTLVLKTVVTQRDLNVLLEEDFQNRFAILTSRIKMAREWWLRKRFRNERDDTPLV